MAELRTPQGHSLLLPEGCVSVGADPANDVPVAAHLGLAPVHFRLQPWEGGHFLEDAGSGLGTLVNGHPVNWKPLTHGDVIVAGELEVVYGQKAESATGHVPVVVAPCTQAPLAALPIPAVLFPCVPPPLPMPLPGSPPPVASPVLALSTLSIKTAPLESDPGDSVSAPPAWLPVDLLPESYRLPHFQPGPAAAPTAPSGLALPSPASAKPQTPHRAARRLVPFAAVCAILVWAGHTAWQRGHFTPLLQSLRPETNEVLPSPDPSLPPVVPDSVRLGKPEVPAARGTSAPVVPDDVPQISSRIGR